MTTPQRRYWFPARPNGWGWGAPCTWQGWAVVALCGALAVAGLYFFPPHRAPLGLVIHLVLVNAGLTLVCWLTGEPPRRRRNAPR